jgi:hypothetical protein
MLVGFQMFLLLLMPILVLSAGYLQLMHVKSSLAMQSEAASYQIISELSVTDLSALASTDCTNMFKSYLDLLMDEEEAWRYQNITALMSGTYLTVYFEYQYDLPVLKQSKVLICSQTYQIPQNY